jgi:ABC-type glycerol-3-phosphate transport system substrate-binding protein
MRRVQRLTALVLLVALMAAACGGDDGESLTADDSGSSQTDTVEDEPGTTAPTTTVTIPEAAIEIPDLQINLVEFGATGFVQIINNGDSDASLDGIILCQFPTYIDLGEVIADGTIAAGATAQVDAATMGGLNAAGGEAALYTARDFTNPDAIFGFVQWGTGGARHEVATAAGIWPAGASIEPDPAFNNIELFGDPADPESWS